VCAAPASLSDGGQPIGPRKSVPVAVAPDRVLVGQKLLLSIARENAPGSPWRLDPSPQPAGPGLKLVRRPLHPF
jgi:hypothetical protein